MQISQLKNWSLTKNTCLLRILNFLKRQQSSTHFAWMCKGVTTTTRQCIEVSSCVHVPLLVFCIFSFSPGYPRHMAGFAVHTAGAPSNVLFWGSMFFTFLLDHPTPQNNEENTYVPASYCLVMSCKPYTQLLCIWQNGKRSILVILINWEPTSIYYHSKLYFMRIYHWKFW